MFHCVLQTNCLGKNNFIKDIVWTTQRFSKIYLFIICGVISLEKDSQSNMLSKAQTIPLLGMGKRQEGTLKYISSLTVWIVKFQMLDYLFSGKNWRATFG